MNELLIYGTVGLGVADGVDGISARDVNTFLSERRGLDIAVRINSGGGWCEEGVAIANMLMTHSGHVSVIVEGVAASAASVIAMAGNEVVMREGSYMMVHDCACITIGNAADHAKTLEQMEVINRSMADIYVRRTGRKLAEIRKEMAAETWMTAAEAVQKKFATRVSAERSTSPTAFDYKLYGHAPTQMAATARRSTGFEEARTRYAAAKKAATDEAVTAFLRQFCLGREKEPDVASLMGTLKTESPAAYATALKLGPVTKPKGQMPNASEIYHRRNNNDDIWKSATEKANKRWGL
ncbi:MULTISPECIES: head maturation protease, ClpP-related [Mesorhizobium]|uniref:head maturation protease, ClpP-related n=1 Tax=Mesorhizobium australicum TaxID=536018 RepID=UPI003339B924